MNRIDGLVLASAAAALVGLGGAMGYWLHSETPAAAVKVELATANQSTARTPLYYQDPDGKPIYSKAPRKTADGRDFKPVYADNTAPASTGASSGMSSNALQKGKILYYRNPMGLPDISRTPKKDSMGMDYIPVHAGEEGAVQVSPERLQMLGVRTAAVERRAALSSTVRATGSIEADESRLAVVSTKFDVVVEKLYVAKTGEPVNAGQPLARVWIDTPDTMMQRGPDVVTREIDYVVDLQEKDAAEAARAADVLRQYGIPDSAIAEIRRTGRATREITIAAPRSGVVLEKQAVEGMRINTGDPLFKIADLSSVWLLADVQEQDLGRLKTGQPAQASLVAFPGRTFAGTVDFIYPTLMTNTRTGRVRIVLPNPDGLLRESMYATVAIDSSETAGAAALVVPDSAVIDSGTQQVVLVQKGQGLFEPRAVRIGARGDGMAQVLSGLKPGEQVVVSANFLIDAESNLRAALQSFASGGNTKGSAP